uniref:Type I antifreeze protein n=1 Tax=Myoxocephalus stelleri TaxID=239743 RepID=A0A7S5DIF5_9TELE|nr:type I antifreeze protein [Myoxocephalus stelleri]
MDAPARAAAKTAADALGAANKTAADAAAAAAKTAAK